MKIQYERRGKQIKNIETGEVQHFNSIAQAKKASRKLPVGSVVAFAPKQPQRPSAQFFHYRGA